ncbi:MAG: RDD family protein [Bacilli bacterium]|nr:RDD family protein [Bacilli bacterium]MBR1817716.1 RDD family protein [Bacilli bacterium]
MHSTVLKRISAYLLDFLLVLLVVTLLSYVPFLNPHRKEYSEKYNELVNVYDRFADGEISQAEYDEAYVPIAYEMYRYNTSYVVIDLVIVILYFAVLPFFSGGQTVGKKLFQIKIEGKDEKKLNFYQYLIRAVVLNNILISILLQAIVYLMDVESYEFFYRNVNLAGYIIQYATLFLVFVRRDGRGLHDMIAGTRVVLTEEQDKKRIGQIQVEEQVLDSELERPKKSKKKDVVEARVIDKKNVVKKKENTNRKR